MSSERKKPRLARRACSTGTVDGYQSAASAGGYRRHFETLRYRSRKAEYHAR
jgi:hypothetical protein